MGNGTLQLSAAAVAPPAAPRPISALAQKTMAGFFWLLAQTLGSKLVNMVGQIVLARLLSPDDFGLVGLAYTVSAFAGLIQQAGLREILIHRHEHFHRWANPAFWMSLSLGCVGAAIMAALAWPAAAMYGEPKLIGLVLVLAATAPFQPLDLVPDALLTSQLRFRFLAAVKWLTAVGAMALSIVFATMKFGAYSFVLPIPIITALRLVLLWSAARPPIRRHLHFRRWKYLFNDSALLLLAGFFMMVTWQGDYVVLGVMHDAKTVGIYFFAFNLSIQTMQVFTGNLAGVLFPALSKLQDDPRRQTWGFLNAASLLAIIGVPLCLLQAALAGPLISILFNSWWLPMIRVLQLLSLGMAVRLVASPSGSLLQAQGRFRTNLITSAVNAVFFIALVIAGSYLGKWFSGPDPQKTLPPARYVAAAVMCYFAVIGPIFMYIAIRPGGGKWRDIWRVYYPPFAAGVLGVGSASLFAKYVVPDFHGNTYLYNLARIAVISVWSMLLYVGLIRFIAPGAWAELIKRVHSILKREPRGFAVAT